MNHILKTDPAVFQAVVDGAKTYEIRFNDRNYAVGDVLQLRETVSTGDHMQLGAPLEYTGREIAKTVSHVLSGYGLAEGWVILSFAAEARPAADMSVESLMPALQGLFAEVFHSPAGNTQLDVFRERVVCALTDYVGATLAAARGENKMLIVDEGAALFSAGPARRVPSPKAGTALVPVGEAVEVKTDAMAWAILGDDNLPFHATCFSHEAAQHAHKGRTVIDLVPASTGDTPAAQLYQAIAHAQRDLPVGHSVTIEVRHGRNEVNWEGGDAGLVVMNGCGSLANAVREATKAACEAV
jgi:hypothetical protein